MAGDVYFPVIEGRRHVDAGVGILRDDPHPSFHSRIQIRTKPRDKTTVGHIEFIVKPFGQTVAGADHAMGVHSRDLAVEQSLVDAVMMVHRRECRPAYKQRRNRRAPQGIEYAAYLRPVADVGESHSLERRTVDDKPVESAGHIIAPRLIMGGHVVRRGVARHVGAQRHERQHHRQLRRRQHPQHVGLGHLLERHEIEQPHPQSVGRSVRQR